MKLEEIIKFLEGQKIEEQGKEWGTSVTQTDIYNQALDQAIYDLKKRLTSLN